MTRSFAMPTTEHWSVDIYLTELTGELAHLHG